MQTETIKIKGMDCASCTASITNNLKKEPGIKSVNISLTTEKGTVVFDEAKINLEKIKKIIKDTGYQVEDKEEEDHSEMMNQEEEKQKIKVIISIILTLPFITRMVWPWQIPGNLLGISTTNWLQIILAFVIVFVFGWQFHRNAFKQIKKFQVGMDSLVSLGTLTAYLYSFWALFANHPLYFESAASITTLILLGRYLELKTKQRASRAMRKLLELGVKKARVINKSGQETQTSVDDINIGDIVMVKPSEKIPLDGIIIEGESNINESMLSGESLPVFKKINDNVFAATINQDGILKIKITKKSNETVLSQIIKAVEEAQESKPPMQQLADKISAVFVPIIIIISAATFSAWFIATQNVSLSLINAISVLIISCPCALGIATPIAVMVGASVGIQKGILIKNGESFEKAKNIDTIIFDKTGTLTEGKPEVKKNIINPEYQYKENEIINLAVSLSQNSEHPVSHAISRLAQKNKIKFEKIYEFKEIPGQGIFGKLNEDKKILLGNLTLMLENNQEMDWAKTINKDYQNSGETILFISYDNKIIGAFVIADKLRENAKETIDAVKKMGLEPIMISGDNKYAAKLIANKLGIEKYLAEVLPNEKQEEVKKLQQQGKKVIFVGDGINDAPSLVQADLGIALASGTDIAKEAGDIILTQNNPYKVIEAIKLSQKTFRIIKQNLFWAFFYNILAIPLATMGLVNPMIGAIAMSLSDVNVIGNSLRIYRK